MFPPTPQIPTIHHGRQQKTPPRRTNRRNPPLQKQARTRRNHPRNPKSVENLMRIFLRNRNRNPSFVQSLDRKISQSILDILDPNGFHSDVLSHSDAAKPLNFSKFVANMSTVKKANIIRSTLDCIHKLFQEAIHVTKPDHDQVMNQMQPDTVLHDVSCMLDHTCWSLNVVVGRLIFSDNGDMIDCTKMGMGGKTIPPNIDRVGDMQSDALCILLVEKDAAYMRLAEDRFYNRFPCRILMAKGQPDVSTRLFLRKMKTELKLPVLALVDSHPYGLKILSA